MNLDHPGLWMAVESMRRKKLIADGSVQPSLLYLPPASPCPRHQRWVVPLPHHIVPPTHMISYPSNLLFNCLPLLNLQPTCKNILSYLSLKDHHRAVNIFDILQSAVSATTTSQYKYLWWQDTLWYGYCMVWSHESISYSMILNGPVLYSMSLNGPPAVPLAPSSLLWPQSQPQGTGSAIR